jgi:5S rRNA maturation endonuclease (ribonuclease M5)
VNPGADGRILIKCHAGCETENVLAARGLSWIDVFDDNEGNGHEHKTKEIVAEYDYVDETGRLLFQVCRFAPKDFRQRRPGRKGGWDWGLDGARRVLFRLPKVLAAIKEDKPVYVVEGEKDVLALEQAGVTATCNPMGARKWRDAYTETLAGGKVVIVADTDEHGRKHASEVADALEGTAAEIRVVEPAEGKDAADHLAAGGTVEDFIEPKTGTVELLERVENAIGSYVVLPGDAEPAALALYVLHTWAIAAAYATPYFVVVSPERRSGKTRLLETLALLVRAPWHTVSTSEAAIFRKIEQETPTLLLDEVEAVFGSYSERTEPLRAVIDAGNRRGATATRVVGKSNEVHDFPTFCPKVLAGIDRGKLPDTIMDRAIVLHMHRRLSGEPIQRMRHREATEGSQALREDLEKWSVTVHDSLAEARPDLPHELSDRAADGWEPLLAIADLAGGNWPQRGRASALELSAETEADEASYGLLALRAVCTEMAGSEAKHTEDLLKAINEDDELPFGGWGQGKGLDGRGLAKLLKPFGVKPQSVHSGERKAKGYRAEDLRKPSARYLCTEGSRGSPTSPDPDGSPEIPHQKAKVTQVTQVTPISEDIPEGDPSADPVTPTGADEPRLHLVAKDESPSDVDSWVSDLLGGSGVSA